MCFSFVNQSITVFQYVNQCWMCIYTNAHISLFCLPFDKIEEHTNEIEIGVWKSFSMIIKWGAGGLTLTTLTWMNIFDFIEEEIVSFEILKSLTFWNSQIYLDFYLIKSKSSSDKQFHLFIEFWRQIIIQFYTAKYTYYHHSAFCEKKYEISVVIAKFSLKSLS